MQRSKKLKVLFLDILTDDKKQRKEEEQVTNGPYSEVFRRKMGLSKSEFIEVWAPKEKLPVPKKYHGIIIGGSSKDPIEGEEKPWMKRVYEFVRIAIEQEVPLLGVCGGHQFIARALGAKVIYNPKGREFGTLPIILTKEGIKDPLFKGIPKEFPAQLSHRCIIKKIDPKWKLLASSKLCKIQAVNINERTRIVQFHPELTITHMRAIARSREKTLIKEGFISEKDFKEFPLSIKRANQASKVLKNFLKYFVLPNPQG